MEWRSKVKRGEIFKKYASNILNFVFAGRNEEDHMNWVQSSVNLFCTIKEEGSISDMQVIQQVEEIRTGGTSQRK